MTSLLQRVRTRLTIHAHRKVYGMLDGEYTSVFHGRSLEFDDLRPYVPGDEVKDVDWKATARLGSLMTRRFVASRKHTVLLVVDTGRAMAATAHGGESKRELAILAAGAAGFIAHRHGDLVGLVSGDAASVHVVAPRSTEAHLERILTDIDARTTLLAPPSDLAHQLEYIATTQPAGRILFVIADDADLDERRVAVLRRLAVRHEILWITIGDADLMREDLARAPMSDVETDLDLPAFVRRSAALREEFATSVVGAVERRSDVLDALSISSQRVTSADEVIPGLFRLLVGHKAARGHSRGRARAGR